MHAMSGATNKKESMLSRALLTHDFELCVHPKHAKWLEQVDSIGIDKTEATHNFLNIVLRNDQRVITQDIKRHSVRLFKLVGTFSNNSKALFCKQSSRSLFSTFFLGLHGPTFPH